MQRLDRRMSIERARQVCEELFIPSRITQLVESLKIPKPTQKSSRVKQMCLIVACLVPLGTLYSGIYPLRLSGCRWVEMKYFQTFQFPALAGCVIHNDTYSSYLCSEGLIISARCCAPVRPHTTSQNILTVTDRSQSLAKPPKSL